MQNTGKDDSVRIRRTDDQNLPISRATGRESEESELRVEELEERIAPRLASNHNETMLIDA